MSKLQPTSIVGERGNASQWWGRPSQAASVVLSSWGQGHDPTAGGGANATARVHHAHRRRDRCPLVVHAQQPPMPVMGLTQCSTMRDRGSNARLLVVPIIATRNAIRRLLLTGMLASILPCMAQAQGETQELRVVTRKAPPIVRIDQGELGGFGIDVWNSIAIPSRARRWGFAGARAIRQG
jgi:hypothetical protein